MANIFESLSDLGNSPPSTRFYSTETGKAIHREYDDIEGIDTKVFTENFIKILDVSIINNNKNLFSKEQQKFFEQYCQEADTTLGDIMTQFDSFLGSYRGEDDNA